MHQGLTAQAMQDTTAQAMLHSTVAMCKTYHGLNNSALCCKYMPRSLICIVQGNARHAQGTLQGTLQRVQGQNYGANQNCSGTSVACGSSSMSDTVCSVAASRSRVLCSSSVSWITDITTEMAGPQPVHHVLSWLLRHLAATLRFASQRRLLVPRVASGTSNEAI